MIKRLTPHCSGFCSGLEIPNSRGIVKILVLLMLILPFFCLGQNKIEVSYDTFFVDNPFSQNDLIIEQKDCIIFQNDTLNKTDSNGLKQGKWIEYVVYSITTNTVNCYWASDKKHVRCNHGSKDKNVSILYNIVGLGLYKDNMKEGVWRAYYTESSLQKEINSIWRKAVDSVFSYEGTLKKEINYVKGKPVGRVFVYWESGRIKYQGIIKEGEDEFKLTLYSEDGKVIDSITPPIYFIEDY